MTCLVDGYIVDLISVIYDVRSTRLSLTLPGHSRRSSAQSIHGITCRGSGRDRCEWSDLRVQSCWAGRKRRLVTVPPRCAWTVILRSSALGSLADSSQAQRPSRHDPRHPRPLLYVPWDLVAASAARAAHALHMVPGRDALLRPSLRSALAADFGRRDPVFLRFTVPQAPDGQPWAVARSPRSPRGP